MRRRLRIPSLSGIAWLCVGSIALGVFSLGQQAISQRRQARAVEWLRSAGVTIHAGSQPYWVPPVGSPRLITGYDVRFPPSKEPLTPYEIESLLTLSGIRALDLSHNSIDDELARKIAGIRSLEHLDLSRTQLTDSGLEAVAQLPALRTLSIGATATTAETVKRVERDRNLKGLYEEWVRWKFWALTGEAAGVSSTMLDITEKTVLRDEALPLLAELPELRDLVIRQSAPIPVALLSKFGSSGSFKNVRILSGVDASNASALPAFASAVEMSLHGLDSPDAVLGAVARLPNLQTLSVVADNLTGQGIGGLKDLPELRRLQILATNGTTISAEVRASLIGTSRRVRDWRLKSTAAGPGYEALTRLPRLTTVEIRGLPMNEVALGHLRNIQTLQTLDLRTALVLSDESVAALKAFGTHPHLERLSLPIGLSHAQMLQILEALRTSPALKTLMLGAQYHTLAAGLKWRAGLEVRHY